MSGATASRVLAVETHAEIGREIRELVWGTSVWSVPVTDFRMRSTA